MVALALALALGPHAAQAQLHAGDTEAAWVRAPAPLSPAIVGPPLAVRRVYGYLPYWESIPSNFHWNLVSDIVAFSADVAADGSISNGHALPGAALVSTAHANGARVHLCATLFNSCGGSEVAAFLASPPARTKAAQALAAISAQIDGVNLDFEFVPSASRDAFTSFVREVRAALAPGQELSLAMPATASFAGYDVPALAAAADRLLLMEYDYHPRGASTAGATAPLPSVQAALDGYLASAPASSIALGVPYYGYDWPTASAAAGSSTSAAGTAVLFSDVFGKFTAHGRTWDAASQTPWYAYAAGTQMHQGWVEDGQSLALKFQLAAARNLGGAMIWALGYDAGREEAWTALSNAFSSGPSAPPPSLMAHGCSHEGGAPFALVVAALAALRRRRGPS